MTEAPPRGAMTVADFVAAAPMPPAADHPAGWDKVADQLQALGDLEPGWDGDDAPAPTAAVLAATAELLADLRRHPGWPAPCRAAATFDGTVVVEWQWPDGLVEVEVTGPGRAEGTMHAAGRPTRHSAFSW